MLNLKMCAYPIIVLLSHSANQEISHAWFCWWSLTPENTYLEPIYLPQWQVFCCSWESAAIIFEITIWALHLPPSFYCLWFFSYWLEAASGLLRTTVSSCSYKLMMRLKRKGGLIFSILYLAALEGVSKGSPDHCTWHVIYQTLNVSYGIQLPV